MEKIPNLQLRRLKNSRTGCGLLGEAGIETPEFPHVTVPGETVVMEHAKLQSRPDRAALRAEPRKVSRLSRSADNGECALQSIRGGKEKSASIFDWRSR